MRPQLASKQSYKNCTSKLNPPLFKIRKIMRTILDAIGSTPLIQIDGIWVKLEFLNPSGSIKARIAKYMIERAEREGLLKPGDTIVEASSGNTGNAMSMVAAVKGYKMLVLMPNGLSRERTAISRAYGAEVRIIVVWEI
jgi:cysteine synthase A